MAKKRVYVVESLNGEKQTWKIVKAHTTRKAAKDCKKTKEEWWLKTFGRYVKHRIIPYESTEED
jgi:hypothetical protein